MEINPKKSIFILSIILITTFFIFVYAQTPNPGHPGAQICDGNLCVSPTGNVGIGTTGPQSKLHIVQSGANTDPPGFGSTNALIYRNDGVANDLARLLLLGGTSGNSIISFGDTTNYNMGRIEYQHTAGVGQDSMDFHVNSNNIPAMTILSSGNVGIGTTGPTGILDVQGSQQKLTVTRAVDVANLGTVALETKIGGAHGILTILEDSGNTVCEVYIRGSLNSVTELRDTFANCETTDTGTSVAILADGDSTYTLKNRLGATRTFYLHYKGF